MQGTVDGLARDSRTLHLAVELTLAHDAPDARVPLVVDQFEELFTLCGSEADAQPRSTTSCTRRRSRAGGQ
jgi:hypothetical protein